MEGEMAGWHHRLDGHEFEWTPGVGDGQGGLACCWFMGSQRVGHNWATELKVKFGDFLFPAISLYSYKCLRAVFCILQVSENFILKYLLIWLHQVLVVTCKTISCGVWYLSAVAQTLSCSTWNLVPWPGIKPRSSAWEHAAIVDHQEARHCFWIIGFHLYFFSDPLVVQ